MDNKVLITGILSAIAVALQGSIGQDVTNWAAIGFAVLMAVLGFIANEWRGQGMTIFGILGTGAYVFTQLQQTGTFTWNQFILMVIAAILSSVTGPPKPKTYEEDPTIMRAKEGHT